MNLERLRRHERTVNYHGDPIMTKPLDLADKYDSTPDPFQDPYVGEEDPTIPDLRIQIPTFAPQVEVEVEERSFIKFPGVGILIALAFGGLFWFLMYAIIAS